jgi:hypothetical protein
MTPRVLVNNAAMGPGIVSQAASFRNIALQAR